MYDHAYESDIYLISSSFLKQVAGAGFLLGRLSNDDGNGKKNVT